MTRSLRPNAREVFAQRLTHTEIRTDKHGRERVVLVTDRWPEHHALRPTTVSN